MRFIPIETVGAHIVRLRTFVLLPDGGILGQYRIILSADTASEVRQMLSQKRR